MELRTADTAIINSLSQVDLEIKSNGRFNLFDHGLPMSGYIQNTASGLDLVVDSVLDRPVSRTTGYPSPFRLQGISADHVELFDQTPVILDKDSRSGGN